MTNDLRVKLITLRNTVVKILEGSSRVRGRPQRFFDPKEYMNLFTRYSSLLTKLKSNYTSLYDDFPEREVKINGTTEYDGRGFIERRRLNILLIDLEACIDLLTGTQTVEIPSMTVTREGVFFAGQYFDALKSVRDIIKQAKKSIVIIDGYIDEQVLDILSIKEPDVEVKLLTKTLSPSLKVASDRFNKQYGKLSIRTSSVFHDRFVIIDDTEFYHFGASIKDLGKRGFMFSRIEEPSVIESLSRTWEKEWEEAKTED